MTLNIENRSKQLASGFVKQAAVNWNQPLHAYLGGATSGGMLGGLIGSGIGGLKGAIRSARAADPGLGNKLKAALRGGTRGGLKGGLIGTGVGAGLGALQVPYGMDTMTHIDRRDMFKVVKDLAAGTAGTSAPKMSVGDLMLIEGYKKKGADFVRDKLRSYNEFAGGLTEGINSPFGAYTSGLMAPGASLGRILGLRGFQPF